jgi:hypothetical protein
LQARRIYVPLTVEINIFLTKTEDNKNEDIHVPKMNILRQCPIHICGYLFSIVWRSG